MATPASLASWLKAQEDRAIVRGLGSLAFIRAQGRTLEEGSQETVLDLLWKIRKELDDLDSRKRFDNRHHAWVTSSLRLLRTNQSGPLAYGQGQKTINVFLKFYVDWASRPAPQVAKRLRSWLHCPLDKVIMEALRAYDSDAWRRRIWEPHYRGRIIHQLRSSMASVDQRSYRAWQAWIRELSPEKPILIDALWSLSRPMGPKRVGPKVERPLHGTGTSSGR
jgi:hypothetical protein